MSSPCPHGNGLQAYRPGMKYDGCAHCNPTTPVSRGFARVHTTGNNSNAGNKKSEKKSGLSGSGANTNDGKEGRKKN